MNNRILISFWILLFAMLLHSCEKDEYIPLSDLELSLAPYNINDTVVFRISNIDTVIYRVYDRTLVYDFVGKNAPSYNVSYYQQKLKVFLIGDDSTTMTIQIEAMSDQNFAAITLEHINSEFLIIYAHLYGEVLDSISVNGQIYSSVYWFEERSFDQRFYILPETGLLKIEFYNSIFEIIE